MHVLQEVGLACVVLCLTVSCNDHSPGEGQPKPDIAAPPSERQRRSAGDNVSFQDLFNSLQMNRMTNTEMYMHFTPTPPAPQNINCYVEIPIVQRQGGQCVQLGMGQRSSYRPWACQAGFHLEVSPHCQTIMEGPGRSDSREGSRQSDSIREGSRRRGRG
ncbi:hypothetical protein ACOMHN_011689 [Nucella lapillus]